MQCALPSGAGTLVRRVCRCRCTFADRQTDTAFQVDGSFTGCLRSNLALAVKRAAALGADDPRKGGSPMQVTYDFSGKNVLLIGGTTGIGRADRAWPSPRPARISFLTGLGKEPAPSSRTCAIRRQGRDRVRRGQCPRPEGDAGASRARLRALRPHRHRLQQCRHPRQDRAGPGPRRIRLLRSHRRQPEGHLPRPQVPGPAHDRGRRRGDRQHLVAVRRHGLRHHGGLLRQQVGRHRPHQFRGARSRPEEHPGQCHRAGLGDDAAAQRHVRQRAERRRTRSCR